MGDPGTAAPPTYASAFAPILSRACFKYFQLYKVHSVDPSFCCSTWLTSAFSTTLTHANISLTAVPPDSMGQRLKTRFLGLKERLLSLSITRSKLVFISTGLGSLSDLPYLQRIGRTLSPLTTYHRDFVLSKEPELVIK